MSDFTSGFWNIWVIGLTILSIVGCAWLLVSTGRIKVASKQPPTAGGKTEVGVTGHVWDGDLQEYNNPLPKWWSNLFWITIVFGVVYLILYPGLGTFPGVLKWSSSGAFNDEIAASDARLKPYETMRLRSRRLANRRAGSRSKSSSSVPHWPGSLVRFTVTT